MHNRKICECMFYMNLDNLFKLGMNEDLESGKSSEE